MEVSNTDPTNVTDTELIGWLKASDEWELHPTPNLDAYYPIESTTRVRCVPLAITPAVDNKKWIKLHGRLVIVKGKYIPYDDLDDAKSNVERILNRKYFGDQIIFNECLNAYVFKVDEIKLYSHQ